MFDRCIPILKIKIGKNTEYSTKKIKSILSSPKNEKNIVAISFFRYRGMYVNKTEILVDFSYLSHNKNNWNQNRLFYHDRLRFTC